MVRNSTTKNRMLFRFLIQLLMYLSTTSLSLSLSLSPFFFLPNYMPYFTQSNSFTFQNTFSVLLGWLVCFRRRARTEQSFPSSSWLTHHSLSLSSLSFFLPQISFSLSLSFYVSQFSSSLLNVVRRSLGNLTSFLIFHSLPFSRIQSSLPLTWGSRAQKDGGEEGM